MILPKFRGYQRENGLVGIRNHLIIISTVACANLVAEKIADKTLGTVACTHPYGCDQIGEDLQLTKKVLENIGKHPNVGGVLVVGLGCEEILAEELAVKIMYSGKPVKALEIQSCGGTTGTIEKGIELVQMIQQEMERQVNYTYLTPRDLIIGLECGGSDFTSGIASNPAVGAVTDFLVSVGAKVVFGETTEILGAEHILAERASTPEIAQFILKKVEFIEDLAKKMRVDIRGAQPSPGNIEGGLSSIEEKSLGAICKTGQSLIVDVLEYADPIKKPGLSFMDTPGNDLACTCGLIAGGAHMVLFTTGRGTPMGFAIAPVIKITANEHVAQVMSENIDVDLSDILIGKMGINDGAQIILDKVFNVAKGDLVAAEKLGHCEFGFHRIGPTL